MTLADELEKIEKQAIEEENPVALGHLSFIEDPQIAGKPVIVEAVVSSTSRAYLVPKEIEANSKDEDGELKHFEETIDNKDYLNIKLVGIHEGIKQNRLNRRLGIRNEYVKDKAWRTVYRVRVRPPVFTLEKREDKIVDEKGFEYKAYDIYITSDEAKTFQPSSLIQLEGSTVPSPKTQKTTFLAHKMVFPDETRYFDVEKLAHLKAKFQNMPVEERLSWILDNFQKYSQIVGRRNLAEASFLAYFTPMHVEFNGDEQKGWGNILIIGDTTTAKSETQRKMIRLLKASMLITAETATTVGLTGTATQIEKEGWFVDWGFLVLLDRKLLAIDGAHKLSHKNWAALAESERNGIVRIAKAAKDTAYARTRQIKIANAVDREADKYSTKSLSTFLYPCQALVTILDKTSIARLDLAVFADQRDVKAADINKEFNEEYDEDLKILVEALKWCWSNTAKISFSAEAIQRILDEATSLYDMFFCEMVPLASVDLKWKLARLSVAMAYLTLSTDDFKTLKVTEEHVEEVVSFLTEEYSKAGLNTLAQQTKFEALTIEDISLLIKNISYKTKNRLDEDKIKKIFKFIVLQGRVTRDQLKTKFGLVESNELRPLLAELSNENLLRSGRGLYSTPKLVEVYKLSRLTSLTTPEKDSQKKIASEKSLESFSGLVTDVNLDKTQEKSGGEFSPEEGKQGNRDKKPISTILNQLKTGPHDLAIDEYHKDFCYCCLQNKEIIATFEDHKGGNHKLCGDCAYLLSEEQAKQESEKAPEDRTVTTDTQWAGFHSTKHSPDVAYKKTVESIRELQKSPVATVITKKDVDRIISWYWTKESYDKVWQLLRKQIVLQPLPTVGSKNTHKKEN